MSRLSKEQLKHHRTGSWEATEETQHESRPRRAVEISKPKRVLRGQEKAQCALAVIGVGALGRHHARILSEMESVDLVAVVDTNPQQGQAIAEKHRTQWIDDYTHLFDSVDAVSIAVPTTAHHKVAGEFLKRGIPLLVEKPLAADVQQATELVELAENNNAMLQVGHIERFNPATQTAWPFCQSPKYIRAERLSPYSFRSTDIGVVHDLMIHDIDLILDLIKAPLQSVEAFGVCLMGGHEDCVNARLSFQNGTIADLTASRVNPTARRSMQVWSEQGCVTLDMGSREVSCYRPSETLLYGTPPVERARQPSSDIETLKQDVFGKFIHVDQIPVPAGDALTAELTDFIDCVSNNRQPLVNGRQALQAMTVAGQVLESIAAHQWEGTPDGAQGPHLHRPEHRKRAG